MVKSGLRRERERILRAWLQWGRGKTASPGYGTVRDSVADTSGLVLCASLSLNNWLRAVER